MTLRASFLLLGTFAFFIETSCNNPPPEPEQVGMPCEAPVDCYPEVDHQDLQGQVQCMEEVKGGYCTHTCDEGADCCAIPGECKSDFPQVYSPFTSNGQKVCMLSCENVEGDANAYCATYAGEGFSCRSSGGGNQNRKICMWD